MGQVHQQRQPRLKPYDIRQDFWRSASCGLPQGYATAFQEKRIEREYSAAVLAELIDVDVDVYMAIEEGAMTPSAEQVVAFCLEMDCHPLDLYNPSIGAEFALPEEMMMALSMVVANDRFSFDAMMRAEKRLYEERYAARAMIFNNAVALRPLLMAIGYSPDFRQYRAPLYAENEDAVPLDKRDLIEYCLDAAQAQLYEDIQLHKELAKRADFRYRQNESRLRRLGAGLYGDGNSRKAYEWLIREIARSPDREATRAAFLRNPYLKYPPPPIPGRAVGERARTFYACAEHHFRLGRATSGGGADDALEAAHDAFDGFLKWRRNKQRLIDWVGNWAVLNEPGFGKLLLPRNEREPSPL